MAHPALALLLAAQLAQPAPAADKAAALKPFPYPTTQRTLKNGLRVVLVPYDSPGLAAYYTLVRVGSRNEPEKGRSGYAHFFEHMMFRGTKKHPGPEYNATVTRLGLNTNAFTSEDMTVYHLYGPSQALPTIIEYEADRFQNLEYTEAQFKTEAGAILGEYAKSASNPELKLEEKMMETAYDEHTYRHTTLGYLDDIKAMPSGFAYSREFFQRYYTPDDCVIIVAGDFDQDKTFALIEKAYGGWQGKLRPAPIKAEPKKTKSRRAEVAWDAPTLPRLWLSWHTPASSDLKAAAVQTVLNAYLFGPTSPLYQQLVLDKQIVDSLEPTWSDHRDPYLFGVLARVKKAEDVAAVEHAVLADIKKLAGGSVDKQRLEAVRGNLKYSAALALDNPDHVAVTLAVTTTVTGDTDYLNKLYAQVAKLQPGDLQQFAARYFMDANRTTVTLQGPKGGAQ